eukprot:COSAG06_NODE_4317_length_4368_cov_3.983134_1_plen_652_part_00
MPTDLGLSLVDNPVATTGGGSDFDGKKEELVVLPEQLRRIGALLSTPEGKPTALCKGALAVLAGYPLCNLLVYDLIGGLGTDGTALALARSGNMKGTYIYGSGQAGWLLSGAIAVHALQTATRAGGFLEQLGAGSALVPRSMLEKLESSGRVLRRVGTAMVALSSGLSALFATIMGAGWLGWGVFFALWLVTLFTWWYSLKVASTLTAAPVDAARRNAKAEAKRMRESGESMDPERWKSLVEEHARKLGRETLPTLSTGWGSSVLVIGVGLVLWASWLPIMAKDVFATISFTAQLFFAAVIFGWSVLPFALAWDPAAVSSNCAKLEDDINHLYLEDPAFVRAQHVLKGVQSLNKQQGLGFVAGGQVITKRTLWMLCTGIYSTLGVLGPMLEGELGLAAGASGAQHAACDFGWTFADGACFKLFGDGVLGQPLGWAEAEEACHEMGSQTHLASVTSEEQQRAVAHLASGHDTDVWIGLNDLAEEGSFVWSDDKPLGYNNFAPGNPDNVDDKDGAEDERGPNDAAKIGFNGNADGLWRDVHTLNAYLYICAKEATPIAANGGFMRGCDGGHWVMGTPYKQAGPLSYLSARSTIVYGIYSNKTYDQIKPTKVLLNETVTTAAECAALVHRDHRTATAAEYSNVGGEWCFAVFDA